MIEDSIREEAKKFAGFWNSVLKDYPSLKLDGTWPSIGILDKILFPLRGKERLDKNDTEFIKGAAAYIGILAYKCWSSYPDTSCQLIKVGDGVEEYLLKATGGKFLNENEEFVIPLSRTLETILKQSNKLLNYFAEDSRFFSFDENIFSSVASGIVSGLTPYGNGKWSKLTQKQFEENLVICSKILSETAVDFYENRFAGEDQGQKHELYFPHLILPPLKYNEPHLGSRSTAALCNFCIEKKLSIPEIKVLCKNLSFCQDETIATAGFIVSAALTEEDAPDWLLKVANSKGLTNALLRPAYALAKSAFQKNDFLDEYENNNFEIAKKKMQNEYNLGLLPLLYLTDFNDLEALPNNLLYFLAWSSAVKAHEIINTHHMLEKLPAKLALQLAFLRIQMGEHEEAESALNVNIEEIALLNREEKFRYYELKSLIALSKNDHERSIELAEEAIISGTSDPIRFATVGNQVARFYLQTERPEQAIILTDQITEKCPWWLSAHLTKLVALMTLKRNDEFEYIQEELTDYFQVSNQLFSFAKATKLSALAKK